MLHGALKHLVVLAVSCALLPVLYAGKATIKVDATAGYRISPYSYGVNWAQWMELPPLSLLEDLGVRVLRHGGNNVSRYNFKLNRFTNVGWNQKNEDQANTLDEFCALCRSTAQGTEPLIQMPIMGWVAGAGEDDDVKVGPDFAASCVDYVNKQKKYRVILWDMDNEPMNWGHVHKDVHPEMPRFDEYCDKFIAASRAMKRVDPSIQIMGPVASNYWFYWDNHLGEYKEKGPFVAYFLERCGADLDILDVHRYVPVTKDLWKAPQMWWHPKYVHEYDAFPEPYVAHRIIPRLREWVAAAGGEQPIAVTEWNISGERPEQPIQHALFVADTLGIFARERVYAACVWSLGSPTAGNPPQVTDMTFNNWRPTGSYMVFKLFARHFGDRYCDVSCSAGYPKKGRMNAYAARRGEDGELTLIVVNKHRGDKKTRIKISGFEAGAVEAYTFSSSEAGTPTDWTARDPVRGTLRMLPDSYTFPGESVTCLIISPATQAE